MKKLCCLLMSLLMLTSAALAAEVDVSEIFAPSGLLVEEDGTLLFTDVYSHAVWEVDSDGVYTKLAGREGVQGADNRPLGAYHDSEDPLEAAFNTPWGIAPFLDGYAITDSENHVVRYLSADGVTTLAGDGTEGDSDGTGMDAAFAYPTGIVSDGEGGLYVADTDNHLIRHIDEEGVVTTYAGSADGMADGTLATAAFSYPTALAFSDDVLYVADTGNHRICAITDGTVTTMIGGEEGFIDGASAVAALSSPMGLTVVGDVLYISDTGNSALRCLSDGILTTLLTAKDTELLPISPRGIVEVDGVLWVGDVFARTLFSIPTGSQAFDDVPPRAWDAPSVDYMKINGLMQGTSTTTFSPLVTMTRAMFVQVLYNMEGTPTTQGELPFTDVPESWFTDAIRWVNSNGITSGTTEDTFSPDQTITREQMVTLLYRYAQWLELDVSVGENTNILSYTDAFDISEYAIEAFQWACGAGIINGTSSSTLSPLSTATRAEAATMLMNFANSY